MRVRVFQRFFAARVTMAAVMFAVSMTAAQGVFDGGDGTAGDPYIITTPAQLNAVRDGLAAHYRLGGDINLDVAPYNTGQGWTPIGGSGNPIPPFTGTFDGNGHTITGMYVNRNPGYVGLFGYVETPGAVMNVGMVNVNINSTGSGATSFNHYIGGLVGTNAGTIDNCFVTGTITALTKNNVGGLVGNNLGGTIKNSYSAANVAGADHVGGLAGQQNSGGRIENSYATGTVTASGAGAGGLVGWHVVGSAAQIINSVALNSSVSGGASVGRIVGSLGGATITLSNNDAWDQMITLVAGSGKDPLDLGLNRIDGGNVSVRQIVEDPTLGGKIPGGIELPDGFLVPLDTAAVTVVTPATLNPPNTVAGVSGHYSAGPVSWTPAAADGVFHNGVEYTATVTLTAESGYTFNGLASATINGNDAQITNNTGVSVTLSYRFPATTDKITPEVDFPTAATITYGQRLAEAAFTGGSGTTPGTFSFATPMAQPDVSQSGEYFQVIFTPENINDYSIVTGEAPVTVNRRSVTVIANANNKTFGTVDPAFAYTVSPSTPLAGTDGLTGELSRDPGESVGDYAIRQGSLSAGGNYNIVFNDAVFTINPAALYNISVTIVAPATGNAPSRSAAVMDAGRFSAGAVSWEPEPEDGMFHNGVEYTAAVTITVEPGYTFNELSVALVNGNPAQIIGNAGTSARLSYKFSATTGKITPEYSFPETAIITYGEMIGNAMFQGGEGSPIPGGLSFATMRAQPSVAQSGDSYKMIFTPDNMDDYSIVMAEVPVIVNPKPLIVTADAKTKIQGAADPAFTYSVSEETPLLGMDVLTGTLSRDPGEEAGGYAIRRGSLSAGDNYDITFNSAVFTITRQALNSVGVTVVAPGTGNAPVGSAGVSGHYSAGAVLWSPEPAGGIFHNGVEYTATVTLTADIGYTFEGLQTATVNGNNAQVLNNTGTLLTLSYQFPATTGKLIPNATFPTDATLTYGQRLEEAALTGGDGTTPGKFSFAAPSTIPGVAQSGNGYLMIFTPDNMDDYNIVKLDVPVTVNRRPLTIVADSKTKVFGEADPALTYTISASTPLVGTDSLTGMPIRDPGEDLGGYPIRQGTLSAGNNYGISFNGSILTIIQGGVGSVSVTVIAPAALNPPSAVASVSGHYSAGPVSWSPEPEAGVFHNGVEYTATVTLTAAEGYTFDGLARATVNGNDAQVTDNTGATVTLSYKFPATTDKHNPNIVFPAGATVTYGQRLREAVFTGGSNTTPGTFSFATPAAQPGVSQSGEYFQMIFTPYNMNDYSIVTGEAPVTVNRRSVTVIANATGKTFGTANPALTYTVSPSTPLVGTDGLTGAPSRDPGESVGGYAIRQGSLSAGGNYNIIFNGAVFTINPAVLYNASVTIVAPATGNAPSRSAAIMDAGRFSAGAVSWEPEPEDGIFHNGVEYTATVTITVESGYTFNELSAALINNNLAQITGRTGTSARLSYKFPAATNKITPEYSFPETAIITYGEMIGNAMFQGGEGSPIPGGLSFATMRAQPSVAQSGDSYKMIFTPDNMDDYSIVIAEVPVIVNPRPLTITADAKTKIQGSADPALTYSVSEETPLLGMDVLTGTLSRDPGEGAGGYAIRRGSLSAGDNYDITFNSAVFTITRQALNSVGVTVVAPGTGSAPVRSAGVSGYYSAGPVSWSPEPADGIFHNGVEYTATVTLTADIGYTFEGLQTATVNGNNAQILSNTGTSLTLSYRFSATTGKLIPDVTFPTGATLTYGQRLGEAVLAGGGSAMPGKISFAAPSTMPGVAQSGALHQMIFTPDDMNDYSVVKQDVPVMVNRRLLAIIADSKTKVFGEADPAFTYTISASTPLVGTDSLTGAPARDPGESLGSHPIRQGSLSAGGNYSISFNGSILTIIQAELSDISVTVIAPATLNPPSAVAGVSGHYSAGQVSWSPEPADGVFHGGVEYTATVTLTADDGYTFNGLARAAINGNTAQITDNTGVTVTLSHKFSATTDRHNPDVVFPAGAILTYGQRLEEAALTGGSNTTPGTFSFATPKEQPAVAQSGASHVMIFTPDNMDDYNIVMGGVPVTVRKAPQDKPDFSWIPAAITDTSVAFLPPEDLPVVLEYSLRGGVWQDSPYFNGLTPNMRYMFLLRFKETENHLPSESVEVEKRTFLTGDLVLTEDGGSVNPVITPNEPARHDGPYGIKLARGIVTDRADFSVTVPGNRKANVVIFDNMGNAVFAKSGVRSGEAVSWDLINTGSRGVGSGSYLIIVTARDETGKTHRYSARFGVRRR